MKRIGITIGMKTQGEDLWINGIKLNALALAKVFQQLPKKYSIKIVNTTPVSLEGLAWQQKDYPTISLEEGLKWADVMICLGGALTAGHVQQLHERGAKAVVYKCGSEYILSMQAVIFNRPMGGRPDFPPVFDQIWAIPQTMEISAPYWATFFRLPVRQVPFVWDPAWFLEEAGKQKNHGFYRPGKRKKRISIFEPNQDVVKYSLYPMLICELAYRQRPDLIEFVSVTNTQHLKHNEEFLGLVSQLDLQRDGKIFFEGRFRLSHFLPEHSDAAVFHQWQLPLNYTYLESQILGYPVIHNGSLCPDVGYFYPGFDIEQGAAQLIFALEQHDQRLQQDPSLRLRGLAEFMFDNPEVVKRYDALIEDLCKH
jgi:hypothetical protein